MATIVTFYSYKGGVGRAMALANIAVLLARKGLRVLAVVHCIQKGVPRQRSGLYEAFVSWLVHYGNLRPSGSSAEVRIGTVQLLAFAMQNARCQAEAEVSKAGAAQQVVSLFQSVPVNERLTYAERVLAEEDRNGVLLSTRNDRLFFIHSSVLEFLAAREIASLPFQDQCSLLMSDEKLYDPRWRNVVLFLAGVLQRMGLDRIDQMISTVLDQLQDHASSEDRMRCAELLNDIVRELAPLQFEPADQRYNAICNEVDQGRLS